MKFFYSCAFLVVFFVACQASPFLGLGSLKGTVSSVVDTSKNIAGELAKDVGRVTSDLKEIGGKVTDINAIVSNLVTDSVAKLLDNLFKVFEYAGSGISSVEDSIKNTKNEVGDQLKNILQEVAGEALNKIQDITGQAVENKQAFTKEMQDGVSNLVDDFLKSYDSAADGVKAMKEKFLEQKSQISDLVKERVQKLITDFVTKTKDLSGFGKNLAAAKKKALEDLVTGISQLTSDVITKLGSVLEEAKNIADKINEAQIEKVREFLEGANNLMRSMAEKFTQIKDKIPEVKQALYNIMANKISSAVGLIQKGIQAALNGIKDAQNLITAAADQVIDLVARTVQGIADLAVGSFKSIYGGLTNIGSSILDVKKNIAKKAQEVLQNLGGKIIEKIKGVVNTIKDVGGKMVETKKKLIQDATEKVNALVSSTIEKIKEAGSNVFQLKNISENFTAAVDKLIDEILKNIIVAAGGAKEISGNISETQKEIGSMVQEIVRLFVGDLTKNVGIAVDVAKTIIGNIISFPSSLISG